MVESVYYQPGEMSSWENMGQNTASQCNTTAGIVYDHVLVTYTVPFLNTL